MNRNFSPRVLTSTEAQPRVAVIVPATVGSVSLAVYVPDCAFDSFSRCLCLTWTSRETRSVKRTSSVGGKPAGSSTSVPLKVATGL